MLTCKRCGRVVTSVFHGCPGFVEAKTEPDPLRTALEAIQELHKEQVNKNYGIEYHFCAHCFKDYPCPTRRLADQGLGDNLARTTKNGENNA